MRLLVWVWFQYSLMGAASASQSTSGANDAARSSAARVNLPFYNVCLADIHTNLPSYNSYMVENSMELPQAVANYYFHIVTLADTADLEADIASSFPFTQFQTFITNFPWYGSLMQKASVTTLFLPQDFVSDHTSVSSTSESQTATSSEATLENQGATTSSSSSSQNKAAEIDVSFFTLFLVLFGAFLA